MRRLMIVAGIFFIAAAPGLFASEAKDSASASDSTGISDLPPELPDDWKVGDDLPDFGIDFNAPVEDPTAPAKVDTSPKEKGKDKEKKTPEPEPTKGVVEAHTFTPTAELSQESPAVPTMGSSPTPAVTATATRRVLAPPTPTPAPRAAAPVSRGPATVKDYFPAVVGQVREYQFYTMPDQEVGRKSRTVECLQSKTFTNGTVRSTFKTSIFAGGAYKDEISTDNYSAYLNVVQQTAHNGQPLKDKYLFKMPQPGGTIRWVWKESDGTEKQYKAYFEPLKAGERIYGDCLVVAEKHVKDGGELAMKYYYYARGVGLVRIEVYGPDLKVDRSASIDLIPAN